MNVAGRGAAVPVVVDKHEEAGMSIDTFRRSFEGLRDYEVCYLDHCGSNFGLCDFDRP